MKVVMSHTLIGRQSSDTGVCGGGGGCVQVLKRLKIGFWFYKLQAKHTWRKRAHLLPIPTIYHFPG